MFLRYAARLFLLAVMPATPALAQTPPAPAPTQPAPWASPAPPPPAGAPYGTPSFCPPYAPYLYAPPGLPPACFAAPVPAVAPVGEVAAPPAREPSPERLGLWKRRPWETRLRVGLGAPWGLLGASLDYSVLPWLSIEGGAGAGIFGPNADVMLHGRVAAGERWALSLGAGLSVGRYSSRGIGPGIDYKGREWNPAVWGNVEAAIDRRFDSGLTLGVRAGLGNIINVDSGSPCPPYETCKQDLELPYGGVSMGYAFSL